MDICMSEGASQRADRAKAEAGMCWGSSGNGDKAGMAGIVQVGKGCES